MKKDAITKRDPYLSDRYLQVFDENYNCIFEDRIPGIYAFSADGKIYIRTDETPEFLELTVYNLSEH